jgi:hypothetical protein
MAAKIVGETADVTRFPNESAFARFAGVGPIPMWSGSTEGTMRNSTTGNRQTNTALHRIALTQITMGGPGAEYYRKRIDAGDRPAMARRCLKRHLARVVYRRMLNEKRTITMVRPDGSMAGRLFLIDADDVSQLMATAQGPRRRRCLGSHFAEADDEF